jgi:very-short-patch-repair endonuclease
MSRNDNLALARIASGQGGLLRASDLATVTGVPDAARRRLRSAQLKEVLPGVLAPASIEITPQVVASAVMLWDPKALLSHHEAATREGIWVPQPDRLRVIVPFTSKRRSLKRVDVVRTRSMPRGYRGDGFHRWTPAPRTVVDLAMLLTRKQLEAVLLSAVRGKRATAEQVEAEADKLAGRAGLADLRRVTSLWHPERESLLEDLLFDDVRSQCDERVVRQLRLAGPRGEIRVDVAIPSLRLAFEADGLAFHSTDEQIAADQLRDRQLLALGWATVRFREGFLSQRSQVRAEVARIITRRRRDAHAA